MDDLYNGLNVLDSIVDKSVKADSLPLQLLRHITGNFSDEQIIGQGGFGVVYKGTLRNGRNIAVKQLISTKDTIDDKQFRQEVQSMLTAQHKNIVRILGYCYHVEKEAMEYNGSFIFIEKMQRLICSEYVTNGTLENHLTDELRGLEWDTRYQIIKGICEGLHHLHKENDIIHMDLKPANILLDDHMVPKITDFGIAKLIRYLRNEKDGKRTCSLQYCAPEYIESGEWSFKSDIYSLGIIIDELVSGRREDPDTTQVLRRWKHRWNKSVLDARAYQVYRCLKLAKRCKQRDPEERPFIWNIIEELNGMDSTSDTSNDTEYTEMISSLEDMLRVEPLELHFPFELNKQISCSLELSNDTDDYMAFRIITSNPLRFCTQPNKEVVPPRSTCSVIITLKAQEKALELKKNELCVESTRVAKDFAVNSSSSITTAVFSEKGKVDRVELTVVLDKPEETNDVPRSTANNTSAGASTQISGGLPSKELLHVKPTVLRCPLDEQNRTVSSPSLQLTNYTNDYVAFMFMTFSAVKYSSSRSKGIMPPWSTWGIVLKVEAKEEALLTDMQLKDKILVQTAVVSKDFRTEDISVAIFDKQVGSHGMELDVVFVAPPPKPRSPTPTTTFVEEEAERELADKLQLNNNSAAKRPTTSSSESICLESIETQLVEVYPLELRFPFEPNKPICSPISIINRGQEEVHFVVKMSHPEWYESPDEFLHQVSPQSTCAIEVTLKAQQHPPTKNTDQIRIFLGTRYGIKYVDTNKREEKFRSVREEGGKAHEVSLMAVICDPCPASKKKNLPVFPIDMTQDDDDIGDVISMDVHPTEPLVLTTHETYICIWSMERKQESYYFKKLLHLKYERNYTTIRTAKFVARMQWIICGDSHGNIRVFTYNGKLDEVKIFQAHDKGPVYSVEIHPSLSYVLSYSPDNQIKLWSWGKDVNEDWKRVLDFKRQSSPFDQIFFSPKDDDTFISFTSPHLGRSRRTIQIWSTVSDTPVTSLQVDGGHLISNYFTACDQLAIVRNSYRTTLTIMDLQLNKDVHSLHVLINEFEKIVIVRHFPMLDVLVTGTRDGFVFIWSSTTYRLMKCFRFEHGNVKYLGFMMNVSGHERLVIGFQDIVEVVDANFI